MADPIRFSDVGALTGDPESTAVILISYGGKTYTMTVADFQNTGVLKTLFDAQTILAATANDTPVALTVAEQTLVGRITSGNIVGLTVAQINTMLQGVKESTADYTILDDDGYETIVINDTDNDRTVHLPTAGAVPNRKIAVFNNNAYSYNGGSDNDRSVIIDAEAAGETINGVNCAAAGEPIYIEHQYCGLIFQDINSKWVIVGTIGACEIDMTIDAAKIELVYIETLQGTLDADASTTVAHNGIDEDKVLEAWGYVESLSGYNCYDRAGVAATGYDTAYDSTNLYFQNVDGAFQGNSYTAGIRYYI